MKVWIIFFVGMFFVLRLSAETENDTALWSAVESGISKAGGQDADDILKQSEEKIKAIGQDAQNAILDIKSSSEAKSKTIRQDLTQNVKEIYADTQEEIKEVTDEAESEIDAVKAETNAGIIKIKQEVTQKILDSIREAEEIIFKINRQKREDAVVQKLQQSFDEAQTKLGEFQALNGILLKIPVPAYWKERVAKKFYKNAEIIEQIVFDAESSEEANDFAKCFQDQKNWFDNTLSSTKYTSDPGYSQIIARNAGIDSIVSAIKISDTRLDAIKDKINLSDEEKRRIRLLVLYEVNSALQKLKYLPYKEQRLADDEVENLTLKVANDVTGRVVQAFPDSKIETVVLPAIPSQTEAWVQLREDLDDLKKTLNTEVAEKNQLADSIKRLNADLVGLNSKLDNEQQIRGELVGKLEVTKKLLNDLKNQNMEQQNKLNITDELGSKKLDEEKSQLSAKHIKLEENGNRNQLELELKQHVK